MSTLTVPTSAWTPRTYLQGLLIHAPSGTRIVHQDKNSTGTIVFRFHSKANEYLGAVALPKGSGHGSTCGVESLGPTSMRLWLRHEAKQVTGHVTVDIASGKPVVKAGFTAVKAVPYGDPSIDVGNDIICIRLGNRFRGYVLSDALAGRTKKLWDITVPAWGRRFQGHLLFRGNLFLHRDVKTNGSSKAHRYSTAGKLIATKTTTDLGDEAEGLCVVGGAVYTVSRIGGNNAKRTMRATPWVTIPAPSKPENKEPTMAAKVKFRSGYTCSCVADTLPLIEREMIARGIIKSSIDIHQLGWRTDVSASAGTHARGGVIDTAQYSPEQLAVWRSWGVEMQHRTRAQGFSMDHGHGVWRGCPHLSPAAADQDREWLAGRNGLRSRGKIAGPGPIGKETPTWSAAKASKALAASRDLAYWQAELGQIKTVKVSAINAARGSGTASRHVAEMQRWLVSAGRPVAVDGRWSAVNSETQTALDTFRRSLGWTGLDAKGSAGISSLTRLRAAAASTRGVTASTLLPIISA